MEIINFDFNQQKIILFGGIALIVFFFGYFSARYKSKAGLVFLLGIIGTIFWFMKPIFISVLLPYVIVPSLLISLLVGFGKYEAPVTPMVDVEIETRKGRRIIRNVFAGVGIFGASRSGKTASVIYSFLKHFSKFDFCGLVYDYKNGELTEICTPLFGDKLKIFAIDRPDISVRLNPIAPKYLNNETDVISVTRVLLDNLAGGEIKTGNFFQESAESLLSAVILKFSMHHKNYCTLPHVISFILSVDFSITQDGETKTFEGLRYFLEEEPRVKIQASAFLMGLDSEKQTAGVISTLANSLRKVAFPEAFWALSEDGLDLEINSHEVDTVLSILNEPKNEEALTPVLATVIHTTTRVMMVRKRKQAFILLDEAPTIKLKNMARITATMASFKIATLYCAQDISQAVVQYSKDGFKAILANMSTLFFGRANDPDTSKFYEQYFEPKKIKTHSKTTGKSASTTIGEREVAKVRSHEFPLFVPGQFAYLSGGKAEVIRFPKFNIAVEEIKDIEDKKSLDWKVEQNYKKVISDINFFAKTIGLNSQ